MKSRLLCFLVVSIVSVRLALAQGTYTQIDAPGATAMTCWGINATGDISGAYADHDGNYHGFLLSGGTFTTINYPGAQNTYVYGVNNFRQVVGWINDPNLSFVYDAQVQTFTDVSYPGATYTYATSINDAGTIAGYVQLPGKTHFEGFERIGSTYSLIEPPGTVQGEIYGITASGKVVGEAEVRGPSLINFSFEDGIYGRIDIPRIPGAQVVGINNVGDTLVGQYITPKGRDVGFVYQNRTLQRLGFPGSSSTAAFGINASGQVVGAFFGKHGVKHGFLWTPPAKE